MNSSVTRKSFGLNLSSVVLAAAMLLTQGLAAASSAGAVSMDVKNKPLCEVMREIQTRSGAEVRVPQNLSNDLISRSAQGATWKAVLGQVLVGYNYSAVWGKNDQPLQLSVSSRNKYAEEAVVATVKAQAAAAARANASEDMLIYETAAFALPQKFQGMDPSSVSPVSVPVERMKGMAIGEKVSLTLPCGQFSVVHDSQIQMENGDVVWVGYLENAGQSYRVIVSMGSNGSQGQVITPEGAYNLTLEEGQTWLVETKETGMNAEVQG